MSLRKLLPLDTRRVQHAIFLIAIYMCNAISAMPISVAGGKLLSRHARSTNSTTSGSGSGGIVEFFEDNNNKAMFLVLPLIVLVYGGCSAIYCVAKCRRYLRKRNRQKKHKLMGPQKGKEASEKGGPPGGNEIATVPTEHFPEHPIDPERTSRSDSQQSIPGQIVDHDDRVPLVTGTARKHTPAPSLQNERMSAVESNNMKSSRNSKTPASIEMDEMYSRNSDSASMASRAAMFTVSNTRRDSSQTPQGQRDNRDMVTPSTSSQGSVWPPSHPPPRYSREDPKAGFKAMLENTNYNPLYSHNADPWESMRAMDRKMGQQSDSAPWANQVKYDEFGRPKPQKKQRLIFVA